MRLLRFLFILSSLFILSCQGNRDKITIKDSKTGTKTTFDVKAAEEMSKLAEQSNDRIEELKKLPPLTSDQLKAMLPEEYMGMKRTNFSANSSIGTSTANATYSNDEGKRLKIELIDCAGEGGAGIYSMRYMTLWDFQQEDDYGYQKTVDFNGQKAIEKYTKSNEEYGLTYIAKDRLLVNIEGEKMSLDEVKDAAKNLNLK